MIKKIKKLLNNRIFIFILGGILFSTVSVYAVTYFPSNQVTYDNKTSGLKSTDVQGAIDELYNTCSLSLKSGQYLYYPYERNDNYGVYKIDTNTGTRTQLALGTDEPLGIAASGDYLYYYYFDGIYTHRGYAINKVDINTGKSSEVILLDSEPSGFVAGGDYLYYYYYDGIYTHRGYAINKIDINTGKSSEVILLDSEPLSLVAS